MNTVYWRNKIMDTMYDVSSGFYLGLSSTLPSDDGTGATEPTSGLNYSRVQITEWSEADDGMITNTLSLMFPQSSGTWFTSDEPAAYWVLFDGTDSDANILSAGKLEETRTVEADTTLTIPAQALSVTLVDYTT